MERPRRRVQTRRAMLEIARTRLQKSWNRSQETFLPAWRPAKAASIWEYARCPECPTDEQRSRHRVLQRRSRPVEPLRNLGQEFQRAGNADWRQRAFRFAHGAAQ